MSDSTALIVLCIFQVLNGLVCVGAVPWAFGVQSKLTKLATMLEAGKVEELEKRVHVLERRLDRAGINGAGESGVLA